LHLCRTNPLLMLITVVSATAFEVLRLRQMLAPDSTPDQTHFRLEDKEVHLLHTGIGIANTALHLAHYLQHNKPDLVIQAGIAGAYENIPLSTVGMVVSETYADLGAEMADGTVQDFFRMGLMYPESEPFLAGRIWNEDIAEHHFLAKWHSLTVNCVSGTQATIDALRQRYPYGQIEQMEGAAFFQACKFYGVPFLQVRAISNHVEVRNRANWKVQEAVESLNEVVWEMIR
jgi:futalosine hydrolase